ncbi:TetR/AcrR family transcriptional regulator [Tsukamurella sp. DT100]|uniref:TetR/AcrR family transcriptional regulator n=1 Tax=Tsukamurella sp. DT100 TaxID=3393415 RepID=UPI003CE89D5D
MSRREPVKTRTPRPRRGRPRSAGLAERRRAELTAAAFDVFVDQGYERASVSDIARRAGIGQGTLYRYVDGKRELLDLVVDKCAEELIAVIAPDELVGLIRTGDLALPYQVSERLGERLFRLADENPGLLKILTVQAGAVDEELRYRIQGLFHTLDAMVSKALDAAAYQGWSGDDDDPAARLVVRLLPSLVLPGMALSLRGDTDLKRRESYVLATGQLLRGGILARELQ